MGNEKARHIDPFLRGLLMVAGYCLASIAAAGITVLILGAISSLT